MHVKIAPNDVGGLGSVMVRGDRPRRRGEGMRSEGEWSMMTEDVKGNEDDGSVRQGSCYGRRGVHRIACERGAVGARLGCVDD